MPRYARLSVTVVDNDAPQDGVRELTLLVSLSSGADDDGTSYAAVDQQIWGTTYQPGTPADGQQYAAPSPHPSSGFHA